MRSLPDSEREAVAAAVTVREVDTDGELEQAASLRAEAYYEDQVRVVEQKSLATLSPLTAGSHPYAFHRRLEKADSKK